MGQAVRSLLDEFPDAFLAQVEAVNTDGTYDVNEQPGRPEKRRSGVPVLRRFRKQLKFKVGDTVVVGLDAREQSAPFIIAGSASVLSVVDVTQSILWHVHGARFERSHFREFVVGQIGSATSVHAARDIGNLRVTKHGVLVVERSDVNAGTDFDAFRVRNVAVKSGQTSWDIVPEPDGPTAFPVFISADDRGDFIYVNLFQPIVKLNAATGAVVWTTPMDNDDTYFWCTPIKIGAKVWGMQIDYTTATDEIWTIRCLSDKDGTELSRTVYPFEELVPWRTRSFVGQPPDTVWEFPLTGANLTESISNGGDLYFEDLTIGVDLLNGNEGPENMGVWQDWLAFPALGLLVPRLLPFEQTSAIELWAWDTNTNQRKWVKIGFDPSEVNYRPNVGQPDEMAEVPLTQTLQCAILGAGDKLLTMWETMTFQPLSGFADGDIGVELNKTTAGRILVAPAVSTPPAGHNGTYSSQHNSVPNPLSSAIAAGANILFRQSGGGNPATSFSFRIVITHQVGNDVTPFVPAYIEDPWPAEDTVDDLIDQVMSIGPRAMQARFKKDRTMGYEVVNPRNGNVLATYTHPDVETLAGTSDINLGQDTFNSVFEGNIGPARVIETVTFTIESGDSVASQSLRSYMESQSIITRGDKIDTVIRKKRTDSFAYEVGINPNQTSTQTTDIRWERLANSNGNSLTVSNTPASFTAQKQPTPGTTESGNFDTSYQKFWVRVLRPIYYVVTDTTLPKWDVSTAVGNKDGSLFVFLPGRNGDLYPDKVMAGFTVIEGKLRKVWERTFTGTGTIKRSNGVINSLNQLVFWIANKLYYINALTGLDIIPPQDLTLEPFADNIQCDLVAIDKELYLVNRAYGTQGTPTTNATVYRIGVTA